MATRKIVTREEVDVWMTQELIKHDDCEGSTLKVKYMLQAPDENGCNWSGDCQLSAGPKTDARHISPVAVAIVARAQAQFNLAN